MIRLRRTRSGPRPLGFVGRVRLARRDRYWQVLIPGWRSYDDPVWSWAIQLPLPFGLTVRFGRGGRA